MNGAGILLSMGGGGGSCGVVVGRLSIIRQVTRASRWQVSGVLSILFLPAYLNYTIARIINKLTLSLIGRGIEKHDKNAHDCIPRSLEEKVESMNVH